MGLNHPPATGKDGSSSCGVASATWFLSEGRRFLRHKRFFHIVSLHPAVYKWVVSLNKARDTKVMQDRSSNVTKDL